MKTRRATYEKIEPNFGSSFTVRQFDEQDRRGSTFWHFHPEIEMVYIPSGNGKRHIGNHLSYYNGGDLVLIGSNLPHAAFTDREVSDEADTVIQFLPDTLGSFYNHLPEFKRVKQLLETAKLGISFHEETKQTVGDNILKLLDLEPLPRLLAFLEILHELSKASDYDLLNAESVVIEASPQDNERINTIYQYVAEHYKEKIPLEDIAELVHLTPPSFSRYFKKITGKTFTEFVNEFRLVHASELLAEEPISITDVCFESGFHNFSHFSKQFKQFTGKSPSEYRKELKKVVGN